MNIPYLTQHISRHLHTIVRSVCLSTGAVFASFCARKDFSDPCLTPEILAACLKQTGDLPLLFSLNQQAVYAIVPLAEAGCPRQFCSVKEKPSNLCCQADEARCSCGKSALVIGRPVFVCMFRKPFLLSRRIFWMPYRSAVFRIFPWIYSWPAIFFAPHRLRPMI